MFNRFFLGSLLCLFSLNASAMLTTYYFENITNNSAGNALAGETQLSFTLSESGGRAVFTFNNSGPAASSITDIYFDDPAPTLLDSIFSIANSSGVSFSSGASPTNLPGGNDPAYSFSADFSADSDSPIQPKGVNPGEFVAISFNLLNGFTAQHVANQLNTGDLRVGIHVQGFANGGSESFINNPGDLPTSIPEPSMLLLFGTGLFGLLWRRRYAG